MNMAEAKYSATNGKLPVYAPRRLRCVVITKECLHGALLFPNGQILWVRNDDTNPNNLLVMVESPDFPEVEHNHSVTKIAPSYRTVDGEVQFESWNL